MKGASGKAYRRRLDRTRSRTSAWDGTRGGLVGGGWDDKARCSLQRVLSRGAGQGLPVVFDFDNTIVRGDIGEAVLAFLARSGRLTPANLSPNLGPPIQIAGRGTVDVRSCPDLMQYYEALLTPTAHGRADPAPLANGYIWATQALEKLSVAEVVEATAAAYATANGEGAKRMKQPRAKNAYPPPRFHQEMVELIAELLRLEYQPWIVSASNVWSVRWMVAHGLNPLLAQRGVAGLSPQCVIGVATLLADKKGRLYKDSVLVRQAADYAALDLNTLHSFRVTAHVQFPAPVYSGKVACIIDALGRYPYLCAGDSPSDLPMLNSSQHKLWIARTDNLEAQRLVKDWIRRTGAAGWTFQPMSTLACLPVLPVGGSPTKT